MIEQPYDRIAEEWDAARSVLHSREQGYLDLVLEPLAAGSTLLDLGCGTGRPIAEYVFSRGHTVVGVDAADELLALARSRFPQGEWLHSRLETYAFDRQCDAALCWDSLFHIERGYHQRIIEGIAGAICQGGRIALTTGGRVDSDEGFTDTMFGHRFFYDSHPPERACTIVERAGFSILLAEFINPPTEGRDRGRFVIVAERNGRQAGLQHNGK